MSVSDRHEGGGTLSEQQGRLGLQELKLLLRAGKPNIPDASVARVFQELRGADGKVSLQELAHSLLPGRKEDPRTIVGGVFEELRERVRSLELENKDLKARLGALEEKTLGVQSEQLAALEEKMLQQIKAAMVGMQPVASSSREGGGQQGAQEEQQSEMQNDKEEGGGHPVHPMFEKAPDDLPVDYDEAMRILEQDTPLESFRELSETLTKKYALPGDIKHLLHDDWSKRLANSVVINFQPYVDELEELYELCRQCKGPFDAKIQQIAESLGGEALLPPLKGKERAESKAQFKYRDQTGKPAYYRLTDILRATLVFKTLKQVYEAVEYVDADAELQVVELTDRNFKPLNGYRDVQISLRLRRDGLPPVVCELQVNTELMAMVKEFRGHRTFEVQRELVAAVQEGSKDRCEKILTWGMKSLGSHAQEDLVSLLNDPGSRFLHHAAHIGCAEVIRCLLRHKADANSRDKEERTPLHEAMAGGHERAVWALLSYGKADVTIQDSKGESAFLEGLVMLRGLPEDEPAQRTVSLVAQHTSQEQRKHERDQLRVVLKARYVASTDLVNASSDGNYKKVKELLRNEMADPDTELPDGRTPLTEAMRNRHPHIVKLLLSVDADPNVVMKDGKHCLVVAAQHQQSEIVGQLLNANADPNVADGNGLPLLAGALRDRQPEFALQLLQAGARAGPAMRELSEPRPRPFGSEDLANGGKYGSIALDAAGAALWCAPFHAQKALRIDASTGAHSFVDVEGLPVGNGHFLGDLALGNDGLLYAPPFNAPGVLVVDPAGGTARLWQHEKLPQGGVKYCGVALADNGVLYCAPYNIKAVLCIDVAAGELRFLEHEGLQADGKYQGIAAGGDGKLYCAPCNATAVLVIDPKTETLSFIEGGSLLEGCEKYFGICAAGDGRLVCAPSDADQVLVVDPWAGALTRLPPLPAGARGDRKCAGICLGADGRLYCAPRNSGALSIDLSAGAVQLLSAPEGRGAHWGIAACDGGRRLVCCPLNAKSPLAIHTPHHPLDDLRGNAETAELALQLSKRLQEEQEAA